MKPRFLLVHHPAEKSGHFGWQTKTNCRHIFRAWWRGPRVFAVINLRGVVIFEYDPVHFVPAVPPQPVAPKEQSDG